jgi:hypothetical protein
MRHANRFPEEDLSREDRRAFRRWVCGLFLLYGTVIAIAIGMIHFNQPSGDLRAANSENRFARLKPPPGPTLNFSSPASAQP